METNYILRKNYLDKIEAYLDKPVIKVITGMRRVGKSVILKQIIEKINNTKDAKIVYINKESLSFDFIKNYKDLYDFVISKIGNEKGKKYIFIDEIQEIDEWEKAIISLLSDEVGDIIITGSNAHMLSAELSTLISGRYVEIPIYPLTFSEFLSFREKDKSDIETEFKNYVKYGGLPGIHFLVFSDEIIYNYLNSILNTIILKDVVKRYGIRDYSCFEKVLYYLFDNVGNITSSKSISDFFKSQRLKISLDTIIDYIRYLENAFILKRVERFDLKGKKILEFNSKIFFNDIGLRHGVIGYSDKDLGGIIENIVYNELLYRGYKVYVGKYNGLEIDFVALKQNEKFYIQVCYSLGSQDVIEREFGNLEKIKDNYRKMVVSLDKFFPPERNGIEHKYLIDFLIA